MFCANCGAQNPDDAKFCFSCGATIIVGPAAQGGPESASAAEPSTPAASSTAAQAAPAVSSAPDSMPASTSSPSAVAAVPPTTSEAPTAPTPNPSRGTPIDAKLKKRIILVVSAAVALVVVAIIIAAVMVNCSGSRTPNASDLVKADTEKVLSSCENLPAVSLYKETYYTPETMKDTVAEAGSAFSKQDKKAAEKIYDSVKELSPWAIGFFEQEPDSTNFVNLTVRDIKGKGDPSEIIVMTYRTPDQLPLEDVLKTAREFTTIDSVMIGGEPTDAGKSYFGDLTYCFGVGRGPGTITRIRVEELGGVYETTLYTYNVSEIKSDEVDNLVAKFEDGIDTYFKTKFTA